MSIKFRNMAVFTDICTCLDTNKFCYDFRDGLLWSIDYTGGIDIGISSNPENKMHFIGGFDEIELKFRGNKEVEIRAFAYGTKLHMYKLFNIDRCEDGTVPQNFIKFLSEELDVILIGF